MTEEQTEVTVSKDEADVVEMLREGMDGEPTDEQKNLAVAQAKLIGDL